MSDLSKAVQMQQEIDQAKAQAKALGLPDFESAMKRYAAKYRESLKEIARLRAAPESNQHDFEAIAAWIVGNDIGASSKYMLATALAGAAPPATFGPDWPRDAADFGRCLRLIERVPSVASALPILASSCPQWNALAKNWDALADLYAQTQGDERWIKVTTEMVKLIFPNVTTHAPGANEKPLK